MAHVKGTYQSQKTLKTQGNRADKLTSLHMLGCKLSHYSCLKQYCTAISQAAVCVKEMNAVKLIATSLFSETVV